MTDYYQRKEVSNSDLTELWKQMIGDEARYDFEKAFRFGSLFDAMITEPHRINTYAKTIDGIPVESKDWNTALKMKQTFFNDPFCSHFHSICEGQKEFVTQSHEMSFGGGNFTLPMRCRYDLYSEAIRYGGDIKSTSAKTMDEFIASCTAFDYWRARALYMDISKSEKDVLIGVSKKVDKIFIIKIEKGDPNYQKGKERYQELAFKWWCMVDGIV
jgi:hypothetical protein